MDKPTRKSTQKARSIQLHGPEEHKADYTQHDIETRSEPLPKVSHHHTCRSTHLRISYNCYKKSHSHPHPRPTIFTQVLGNRNTPLSRLWKWASGTTHDSCLQVRRSPPSSTRWQQCSASDLNGANWEMLQHISTTPSGHSRHSRVILSMQQAQPSHTQQLGLMLEDRAFQNWKDFLYHLNTLSVCNKISEHYSWSVGLFFSVVRPSLFGLGRGLITSPGPAMVLMDRKDLVKNKI